MSQNKHEARVPDYASMDISDVVMRAFGMTMGVYYEMLGAMFDNACDGLSGKHRKCNICNSVHVTQDTRHGLFGM